MRGKRKGRGRGRRKEKGVLTIYFLFFIFYFLFYFLLLLLFFLQGNGSFSGYFSCPLDHGAKLCSGKLLIQLLAY